VIARINQCVATTSLCRRRQPVPLRHRHLRPTSTARAAFLVLTRLWRRSPGRQTLRAAVTHLMLLLLLPRNHSSGTSLSSTPGPTDVVDVRSPADLARTLRASAAPT